MANNRLEDLFHQGASAGPVERGRILQMLREEDPDAAQQLKRLWAGEDNETDGDFLSRPAVFPSPLPRPGTSFGRYRILEEIGAGGMGVVFRAEQDNPQREVALKVLRHAAQTSDERKRFSLEAAILGQLRHPGIAEIYDAGAVEEGAFEVPFFVMELIAGEPIDTFVHANRLSVQDRIRLFVRVCEAVAYAHERGIIHRDLKPANILVARADPGESARDQIGHPKVLDFGVARLLDPNGSVSTMHTEAGQIVGTLGYMSPEQLSGRASDVDARSDVYSLGVLLFRLLTGRMHLELDNKPMAEAARILADEEPARLSSVDRSLRGDLETIVATAIQRDPDRRYRSAGALARDLMRFLGSEPIEARPASLGYRSAMFVRRNRVLVGGAAATFFALVVGLATTSISLRAALQERDAKESALSVSKSVVDFMVEVFQSANPGLGRHDITVRAALDEASARVDERFEDQPEIASELHLTLAQTYTELSALKAAEVHARAALSLLQARSGTSRRRLETKVLMGRLLTDQARFDEAASWLAAALERLRAENVADDALLMDALIQAAYAETLRSRFDAAQAIIEEAEAVHRSFKEPLPRLTVAIERIRGTLDARNLDYASAEKRFRRVAAFHEAREGRESLAYIDAMTQVAIGLPATTSIEAALDLRREILELQKKVQGPAHRKTLGTMNGIADALFRLGRMDEASAVIEEALAVGQKAYGPDARNLLFLNFTQGNIALAAGRLEQAEQISRKTLADLRRLEGPDSEGVYWTELQLLRVLRKAKKHSEMESVARQGIERVAQKVGQEHPRTASLRHLLGVALKAQGRCEEAVPHFEMYLRHSKKVALEKAPIQDLAACYDALGRSEDAMRWREKLAKDPKPPKGE